MPTKHPRVNVMLEEELYEAVKHFAKLDKVSLSEKIKELVRHSLEEMEDQFLSKLADERVRSFDKKKALSHQDIFG